jgi:hypothetical protein
LFCHTALNSEFDLNVSPLRTDVLNVQTKCDRIPFAGNNCEGREPQTARDSFALDPVRPPSERNRITPRRKIFAVDKENSRQVSSATQRVDTHLALSEWRKGHASDSGDIQRCLSATEKVRQGGRVEQIAKTVRHRDARQRFAGRYGRQRGGRQIPQQARHGGCLEEVPSLWTGQK